MRRVIGVRISEERKVYEGEVKFIEVRKMRYFFNLYVEILESVIIIFCMKDDEKMIRVGREIVY